MQEQDLVVQELLVTLAMFVFEPREIVAGTRKEYSTISQSCQRKWENVRSRKPCHAGSWQRENLGKEGTLAIIEEVVLPVSFVRAGLREGKKECQSRMKGIRQV